MTFARCRSRPPGCPAAFIDRAIAVIRAIAALASTAGSFDPASVAVPSSSANRHTCAPRSALCRRRSAPSGSAAITAWRSRLRNSATVSRPALGSTVASTARASSSLSTDVASAITRARSRSIRPAASAAPVVGSRHDSVMARSAHQLAP